MSLPLPPMVATESNALPIQLTNSLKGACTLPLTGACELQDPSSSTTTFGSAVSAPLSASSPTNSWLSFPDRFSNDGTSAHAAASSKTDDLAGSNRLLRSNRSSFGRSGMPSVTQLGQMFSKLTLNDGTSKETIVSRSFVGTSSNHERQPEQPVSLTSVVHGPMNISVADETMVTLGVNEPATAASVVYEPMDISWRMKLWQPLRSRLPATFLPRLFPQPSIGRVQSTLYWQHYVVLNRPTRDLVRPK